MYLKERKSIARSCIVLFTLYKNPGSLPSKLTIKLSSLGIWVMYVILCRVPLSKDIMVSYYAAAIWQISFLIVRSLELMSRRFNPLGSHQTASCKLAFRCVGVEVISEIGADPRTL